MALPLSEKLTRMLRFLVAARSPDILRILARRGFSTADLEEGWSLFSVACGTRLTYVGQTLDPAISAEASQLLARLDQWENTWFPVIAATLERRFPDLHATVFQNLSQTTGLEVLVSVGTMLDRIEALASSQSGKKALDLLAARGLTPAVRTEASALLSEIRRASVKSDAAITPDSQAEQEQAATEAWAWYREWSQIARTLITRGDHLVQMGLKAQVRRSSSDTDEPEAEAAETPTTKPA